MTPEEFRRKMEEEDAIVAEALRGAGVRVRGGEVRSVYDLVNTKEPYPKAIPVLLEFLPRVTNHRIKEGVARALGVREARPYAARPLIREFLNLPTGAKNEEHSKWAIGYALATVADDSVFEEILAVLVDRRHGWTRSGMVLALCNMQSYRDRAVEALMNFLDDEELANLAVMALGNLRVREAASKIETFLSHPDSWVRQQAKRALNKIEKGKRGK